MDLKFEKLIIDIQVLDLDRGVNFYKEILGLKLMHKEKDWASFEVSGAEIHLYLHGGTECGIEFRVSNIDKQIKILKEKGVEFFINPKQKDIIKISEDVMECSFGRLACFKDSEGNNLALVEDN